MTLEEYRQQLDEALEKLDWQNPGSRESDAHKVLEAASVDKSLSLDEWMRLYERYRKAVKKL
ncbi:hypothetical protein [uncultured Faecalibacterium sp.]|uniref:hypothetical protein n=1 Tax=uncultured Faecalibacterium sp. TaxID=259315 RepID=UPI0026DB6B7F|nr:hypothetical protein [uncultured Faecalibacterium sp.]